MSGKIGLALGGGAALGGAHIGVLKALDELEIKVDYISGTSIGALVGALYAFGLSWKEIEKIAVELKWVDITDISLSKYGLLSNKKLEKILKENIGSVQFDEAEIPLAVVATDIASGNKVVLDKGGVADAIKASTCIPGIFKPVEIDGKMLVDGGIVDNVPVSVVSEMGADRVIGVDLNTKRPNEKPRNILEVIMNSFVFALMSATKLQTTDANLLIRPDLSKYSMVSTNQTPDLIEEGYKSAMSELKKL